MKILETLKKAAAFSSAANKILDAVQQAKENDGKITADEALVIVDELVEVLLPLVEKSAMKIKETDLPDEPGVAGGSEQS